MLKIKISYKWLPFQETVQALLINQFDPMLQFLFTSYGKQKKWISKPLPSHKESAVLCSPSPCFDVWCGYWYWLLGFGQQCRLHLEFMERTPRKRSPSLYSRHSCRISLPSLSFLTTLLYHILSELSCVTETFHKSHVDEPVLRPFKNKMKMDKFRKPNLFFPSLLLSASNTPYFDFA